LRGAGKIKLRIGKKRLLNLEAGGKRIFPFFATNKPRKYGPMPAWRFWLTFSVILIPHSMAGRHALPPDIPKYGNAWNDRKIFDEARRSFSA